MNPVKKVNTVPSALSPMTTQVSPNKSSLDIPKPSPDFNTENYAEMYQHIIDTFSPTQPSSLPNTMKNITPYAQEPSGKKIIEMVEHIDKTVIPKGAAWLVAITSLVIGIGLGITFSSNIQSSENKKMREILNHQKNQI